MRFSSMGWSFFSDASTASQKIKSRSFWSPGPDCPTRFFALGIGQFTGGVHSLHVDDDGFGPRLVQVMRSGRMFGVPP